MDTFIIEINNWDKYQGKRELKRRHWVRLDHEMLTDSRIIMLDPTQKWLFISLILLAAKNNSPTFETNLPQIMLLSGVKKDIERHLDALEQYQLLTHRLPKNAKCGTSTRQNRTEHNKTEQININLNSAFNADALKELWNQECGSLPKVKDLTQRRRVQANARLKKNSMRSYWLDVIHRIRDSAFCNGDNKNGWCATFDFLIRPDTHVKAMEGQYDDRGSKEAVDMEAYMKRAKEMIK